jgi:hypothetical protein
VKCETCGAYFTYQHKGDTTFIGCPNGHNVTINMDVKTYPIDGIVTIHSPDVVGFNTTPSKAKEKE